AAAASMQLATQRSELFAKPMLDSHVDVFGERRPHPTLPRKRGREFIGNRGRVIVRKFRLDFLQRLVDTQLLSAGQHSATHKRLRVGAAAGDVLSEMPAVARQRAREAV